MALRFAPTRGAGAITLNALIRGPQGEAATVDAGTTTTGAAGSSASVSNSGNTSEAIFDFAVPRGADAGMRYSFESSTSMAAPASGGFRLNNATLSSVTAIAVNATNADSVDVSDYIATWDDSTNTTKGTLVVRKEGSGAVLGVFTIGTVTDNTTWLQVALTYVSGSGSFSASDKAYLTANLTGNKGSDGQVAGPGSSVDSEIALWSGTSGATLKRAAGTGYAKLTSGVLQTPAATVPIADMDLDGGTALTAPDTADEAVVYDASATANRKITLANLWKVINTFTAWTTPAVGDSLPIYDSANSAAKKITLTNLWSVINGFTADTAPDGTTDYVATYDASASGAKKVLLKKVGAGKQTIWIPAAAWSPRTSNGCAALATVETTTNKVNFKTLDFDASTAEYAQCVIQMPKGWNEGTLTAVFVWSHASTTTNFAVVWALQGLALSDDDAGDTAFGTAQTVTDTGGTTDDIYRTAATSAITVSNTPAENDIVYWQAYRDAASGSDTLGIDARLHGVMLVYTTDQSTDD